MKTRNTRLTATLATIALSLGISMTSIGNADPATLNPNINPDVFGNITTANPDLLDQHLDLGGSTVDVTTLFPDITISNLTTTGPMTDIRSRPGYRSAPVSFTLNNVGNVDTSQHFDVHAYIHANNGLDKYLIGLRLDNQSLIDRGIASGASIRVSGTLTFADHDFFSDEFYVIADSCAAREFSPQHCDVKELDENNNRSNTARL